MLPLNVLSLLFQISVKNVAEIEMNTFEGEYVLLLSRGEMEMSPYCCPVQ